MNKKFLKNLIVSSIAVGFVNFLPVNFSAENLQIVSVAHAEMKNYSASDVAMLDFGENDEKIVETVKKVAKERAIKAAREKSGVYFRSFSRTLNGNLTDDEISAVTNNISEILSVNYEKLYFTADSVSGRYKDKAGYLYKATVEVKIDDTEIYKYLQLDAQEKSKIILQDKNLQRSLVEIDNDFENLRETAKNKTPEQIQTEVEKIDNEISASEKISEGNKFAYQKDYSSAVEKYNEAIEINPNSNAAKKNLEILEGKETLPDSSDAKYYYNRAVAYFDAKDYERALNDFKMVIRLEPNFKAAYRYKEICEQKVSENKKSNKTTKKSIGGKEGKLKMKKPKRKNSVLEDTLVAAVILADIFKK